MTPDTHFYKAMQTVTARRQKAETAAINANAQALQLLPQLCQLRQKRNEAGMRASALALDGAYSDAVKEALALVEQYSAKENALLAENGIAPASLTPQYTCPVCRDTGKANGKVCTCVLALAQKLRAEAVNAAFPFPLYSFATFDVNRYSATALPGMGKSAREQMQAVLTLCQSYANEFDMDNGSLFFYGSAGVGKTHLALSIAGAVRQKGFVVVYASAQSVFADMEKEKFGQGGTSLQALLDAQLLVLDDLGTEYITPYVASCLYNIVNTRSVQHLPTVYTSNIVSAQDLARRYTEKVASRLLGECDRLYCVGEDMRLQAE